MRSLLCFFLCSLFAFSLQAQEPHLHPTQVGLFGAGANAVFMSDPANLGGQWVAQSSAQSSLNYWTLSGTDVYRPSGNVGINTSAPAKHLDVNGALRVSSVSSQSANGYADIFTAYDATKGELWLQPEGCIYPTKLAANGGLRVGAPVATPPARGLSVQGAINTRSSYDMKDAVGGNSRWSFSLDGTETGSGNSGGNLALYRFADAGGYLGTQMYLNRATGTTSFGTASAGSTVNVYGNMSIGSGYVGTAAPVGGIIVQGNALFGTSTDNGVDRVQVDGSVRATKIGVNVTASALESISSSYTNNAQGYAMNTNLYSSKVSAATSGTDYLVGFNTDVSFQGNSGVNNYTYGFKAATSFKGTGTYAYGGYLTSASVPTSNGILNNNIGLFAYTDNQGSGTNITQAAINLASVNSGTGSVTENHGIYLSSLSGGTTNYGIRTNVSAAAANWSLYVQGTAKSYHSGTFLIGSATDNGTDKLQVTGSAKITSTLRLGSTAGTIATGNGGASVNIWDRGAFSLPTFYTASAAPSGTGNGDIWQELSSRRHGMVMRANDTNKDVAFTTDVESIKGKVAAAGTLTKGRGATVSKVSTGIYSVAFPSALSDANYTIVLTTPDGYTCAYSAQNTTGFQVITRAGGTLTDSDFMFQVLPL